jgi:hypothetical protein
MLDAHPSLAIPPESYFITGLYRFRGRYERRDGTFDYPKFARELQGLRKYRDWDLPEETLMGAFASVGPGSFADAVRLLYTTYATSQGKKRYGDKTPGYVARMKLLTEIFPEASFVHIIRDVRSVALSLSEITDEWGTATVPQGAARWVHRVGRGHRDGLALGPQRYLEVRYEDLVEQPERELRRLIDFAELPWDDAVLDYEDRAMSRIPEGSRTIHANVSRPPTEVRDWRAQIAPEDLAAVEAMAGPLLSELGYELVAPTPSADAKARADEAVRWWATYLKRKKRRGRFRRRLTGLRPGVSQVE